LQDIVTLQNADLFVYAGKTGEPWVERALNALDKPVAGIELSNGIDLTARMLDGDVVDPHVWLDMTKAVDMVIALSAKLGEIDPGSAEYYIDRAQAYKIRLNALDNDFWEIYQLRKYDTLVFGSHFAAAHLCARYRLYAVTVYDSCEDDADPSGQTILDAVDAINANGYPVVLGEENSANRIAVSLAEETGAQVLIFNAAHNISKADMDAGLTFEEIMKQNVRAVKAALGVFDGE